MSEDLMPICGKPPANEEIQRFELTHENGSIQAAARGFRPFAVSFLIIVSAASMLEKARFLAEPVHSRFAAERGARFDRPPHLVTSTHYESSAMICGSRLKSFRSR
jgi:hypothetical protein